MPIERMLVSGYTDSADDAGVLIFEVSTETGNASKVAQAAGVESPSFCQKASKRIYAASEMSNAGGLASFSVGEDRSLQLDGQVDFEGAAGTCFVLFDKDFPRRIYGADYNSGSVSVAKLAENGTVSNDVSLIQHEGHSAPYRAGDPNADRQLGPHVHTLSIVPETDLLAAVDLGLDAIVLYRLDANGDVAVSPAPPRVSECDDSRTDIAIRVDCGIRITRSPTSGERSLLRPSESDEKFPVPPSESDDANAIAELPLVPAAIVEVPLHYGPRIVSYHPTRPLGALICELACKVLLYEIGNDGLDWKLLEEHDLVCGMPNIGRDGKPPLSAHCEFSSDGRFLYTSTRGTDQLTVFEVGDDDHLLPIQTIYCEGDTPRHFALSPDESIMAVANQLSDNVSIFKRDAATGKLEAIGSAQCDIHPSCIVWI